MTEDNSLSCPLPYGAYERVVLAHGGGGRAMRALIRDRFAAVFGMDSLHDGADLGRLGDTCVTTDAFVVKPLFFPGGDIGSLAVHGVVNDLAMCGARAAGMSVCFILEEGLLLSDLDRVVRSLADTAKACGVRVVTGDTKVVERGHGDGLYVSATAWGPRSVATLPTAVLVRPGDAVLVSGPVGDHGTAVMLARGGHGITGEIRSDCASVADAVFALLDAGIDVRFLRDPTRGGLTAVLDELANDGHVGIRVREVDVPVRPAVADACELLGLDPLLVACEGRFVAVIGAADLDRALALLRARPDTEGAACIGEIVAAHPGLVVMVSPFGGERVLDLPEGEQLPRIC